MFNRLMVIIVLSATLIIGPGQVLAQADAQGGCTIRTDWPAYTVQRGDTLYSIARRAGITVAELMAGNCLTSNLIIAGATLRVPGADSSPGTGPMIDIQQPASGSTLTASQPFTVSGTARALFEGALVVQVLNSGGGVLSEQPVTAGGDVGVGGTGPWSASFTVTVPAGASATIYAYATSARDGSVIASDQVSVTFGTTPGCTVRTDWPVHVVQRGENLFRIGLRYNVTYTTLMHANCLSDPGRIFAGQRLHVPAN